MSRKFNAPPPTNYTNNHLYVETNLITKIWGENYFISIEYEKTQQLQSWSIIVGAANKTCLSLSNRMTRWTRTLLKNLDTYVYIQKICMWQFQISRPIVPFSIHESSKFIDRVTSISHNELECHAHMFGMGFCPHYWRWLIFTKGSTD